MSTGDFLFQGQPPPQITNYGSTTTSVPDWWAAYTQGLISQANAIAAEPYQVYGGPRVAGFSDDQEAAFEATRNAQGIWDPYVQQATDNFQAGAAPAATQAAQGYLDTASGFNGAAAAQPYLQTAAETTYGTVNQNMLDDVQGFTDAATSMSGVNAASPYVQGGAWMAGNAVAGPSGADVGAGGLNQVAGRVDSALSRSGLDVAQPYLNQAGATWPSNVDQYMNPYTQQVTNRLAELGAENLHEKLLPGVNDTFTNAGQFGSRRHGDFTQRALRNTQREILGAQSQALERGYTTGAGIFGQDQSRLAGLGATAGGLGSAAQQAGLTGAQMVGQAGAQLGQLTDADVQRQLQASGLIQQAGSTLGGLTTQQQQQLINAGQLVGQTGHQDVTRDLQAGQQMGALGQAAGNLENQTMANFGQLGATAGNLANADAARAISAGQGMGALASSVQGMGLRDAAALEAIGQTQQQQQQQNLNIAHQDFVEQRDFPKTQIRFMNEAIRGMAPPSTSTQAAQTGTPANFQPSPLAQIAGSGLSAVAMQQMLNNFRP